MFAGAALFSSPSNTSTMDSTSYDDQHHQSEHPFFITETLTTEARTDQEEGRFCSWFNSILDISAMEIMLVEHLPTTHWSGPILDTRNLPAVPSLTTCSPNSPATDDDEPVDDTIWSPPPPFTQALDSQDIDTYSTPAQYLIGMDSHPQPCASSSVYHSARTSLISAPSSLDMETWPTLADSECPTTETALLPPGFDTAEDRVWDSYFDPVLEEIHVQQDELVEARVFFHAVSDAARCDVVPLTPCLDQYAFSPRVGLEEPVEVEDDTEASIVSTPVLFGLGIELFPSPHDGCGFSAELTIVS